MLTRRLQTICELELELSEVASEKLLNADLKLTGRFANGPIFTSQIPFPFHERSQLSTQIAWNEGMDQNIMKIYKKSVYQKHIHI